VQLEQTDVENSVESGQKYKIVADGPFGGLNGLNRPVNWHHLFT